MTPCHRIRIATWAAAATFALLGGSTLAQAPLPNPQGQTVHLTMEQRHVIKEIILKDLKVGAQAAVAPVKVGDVVPSGVTLAPIPVEVSAKVPQLKTHSYFVKDDAVIIVDPTSNKVTDRVD